MNKQLKVFATASVALLLLLSLFAAAVMAKDAGSVDSGSSGSSVSDSSGSGSSSNSDDNNDDEVADAKTDIRVKDAASNTEIRIKEDANKQTAEVRIKDAKAEVKVKTEGNTGFAGIISRLMSFLFGKREKAAETASTASQSAPAETTAQPDKAKDAASTAITTAPGITIDKTLSSGPGYPTGPLDLAVPATQMILDRVGTVKGTPAGQLEVKDRQYEIPLETVPPTVAAIPVTINGVSYTASEVKVISNLKTKAGTGQHSGTIDVDIDVPLGSTLPAGHITLQYSGSAIVSGSMISSGGLFKTSKMTGVFAGLVSEGTYTMTIIESGQTFGSPAIVSISTTSTV